MPIKEDHYMGRYLYPDLMNQIIKRYDELTQKGIPEPEKERAIMSEFAYGSHFGNPWPPRGTGGYDTVDRIYPNLIPAEAYPPKLAIDEEVAIPSSLSPISIGAKKSQNWLGLSASTIGGPIMHGEEPAINKRQMPEEAWLKWTREAYNNEDGVWRTIRGRKIFIKKGESLSDALKRKGMLSDYQKSQNPQKGIDDSMKKTIISLGKDPLLIDFQHNKDFEKSLDFAANRLFNQLRSPSDMSDQEFKNQIKNILKKEFGSQSSTSISNPPAKLTRIPNEQTPWMKDMAGQLSPEEYATIRQRHFGGYEKLIADREFAFEQMHGFEKDAVKFPQELSSFQQRFSYWENQANEIQTVINREYSEQQAADFMDWEDKMERSLMGETIREQEPPRWAKFVYANQENCPICKMFDGMIFDLNKYQGRPVVPSEHKLYTSTHPNCECTWDVIDPILYEDIKPSVMPADRRDHISHVNRIIGQKARRGTLHPLKNDGSVFEEFTLHFNPRHIMETVTELREQFQWLSPQYMQKIHAMDSPGKFLLIRAAAETVTDHRIEGEPYRRLLSGLELYAMARTAVGKGMDINHNAAWKTPAVIMDSEGDIARKEIQMLVYETDPEILNAISNGTISAVSINGGAPRQNDVECGQSECFLVPKGVILGENDGIALTYVVTNPQGFRWRGQFIPPAEPGVKTTKIEIL